MKCMKKFLFVLALFLPFPSCYDSVLNPVGGDGTTDADGSEPSNPNCPGGTYIKEEIPVQTFIGVDILVVVDNSGSMAAEQTMLRDAIPNLLTSIMTGQDEEGVQVNAPVRDVHIGVISTDMGVGGYSVQTCEVDPMFGDDGILQHTPRGTGCASSYPNYLAYAIPATQDPDLPQINQLATDFGCIAVLGTDGCGFEQQLEAARKALIENSFPGGPNAGFLREDTILVILFVTDEEDCSASDPSIFDVAALPYSINLQCFYQPASVFPIDRYIRDFKGLRGDPDGETPSNLVVGFIVGVPPGEPACNGRGDEIGGCLSVPAMAEVVRADGQLLEYACKYPPECTPPNPPYAGNCTSEAFPGRRFVEMAQALDNNAVVQSICTDSFVPAVEALTEKLRAAIKSQTFDRQLQTQKDPSDPTGCRCLSLCKIIEELSDNRACPSGKPAYDANGDTTPDMAIDEETGLPHSLCVIPQAGSITSNCALPCDSPDATYSKDPSHQGWWYNPYGPTGVGDETSPTLSFEGSSPASDSGVSIECCFQ